MSRLALSVLTMPHALLGSRKESMHVRTLACLVVSLALAGCSTEPNRCPSGYHQQSTLCMPNYGGR
jgi:hypothetical protein